MNSKKMWICLFCFAWFTLMISPAFSETASSGEIATGPTEPIFHKVIFAPGYPGPATAMFNSQGYLRIILDFTKLPTQQGWGYFLVGNTWPETSVFTIAGDGSQNWLHQDSMHVGFQDSGSNAYANYIPTISNLPATLKIRARVLQDKVDPRYPPSYFNPWGFGFCFYLGSELYGIGLRPHLIGDINGRLLGYFDNTQFHDYRLEATPGVGYRFFIDDTLFAIGPLRRYNDPYGYFQAFGDCTGGVNAIADIAYYEFYQGPPLGVISVEAMPPYLWIGSDGAGSSVVFRALTTEATIVNFKVTDGMQEWEIGNIATQLEGSDNVARLEWFGDLPGGGKIPVGSYNIVARAGTSSKMAPFEVKGSQVTEIKTYPDKLWVDLSGNTTGIVFVAKANYSANVVFKVTDGIQEWEIGNIATQLEGGDNVARLEWFGDLPGGGKIPIGSYNIVARAAGDPQMAPFEVKGSQVTEIKTYPDNLWVDPSGNTTGIVFVAKTNYSANVIFKVRIGGIPYSIGTAQTSLINGEHIAKITWWGEGVDLSGINEEICYAIAEAGGHGEEAPFTIKSVENNVVGMGDWMLAGKDPAAQIPRSPGNCVKGTCPTCPPQPWDQILGPLDGWFFNATVGDPVNIVSGNLVYSQIDLQLKARHSLVLARIYNSLDSHIGPFGRGWSSPYFSRLEFPNGKVRFVNADGSRILFEPQGNGYAPPKGIDLQLSHNTDTGFWTLAQPQGTQWTFDLDGKLLKMTKACCGQGVFDDVTLAYDAQNRLSQVTNPVGQFFQFDYNSAGRIVTVTDSSLRTLFCSYDSDQNLVSVTGPLGQTTTYEYEEAGFLSEVEEPGNRLTVIGYTDRRVTSITDPNGATTQFGWDFMNYRLLLTDAKGITHEYRFSPAWRLQAYAVPSMNLTKELTSQGFALIGFQDSLGGARSFAYNPDGLMTAMTDEMGNLYQTEYQPNLHTVTKTIDPLGREWRYTWCRRGNLIEVVDPNGGITSYTYDTHNNRLSKTDPLGRVTRWVYNSSGNYLVQAVDPEGGITSFSYDNRGNLISSSDPLGRATQFQYDLLDRLTKTIYPDSRFIEIEYDQVGNVVLRRDNLGRETRYTYDLANRLIVLIRPDGTTFNYAYNAAGQKISETDSLGRITYFEYSPIDLLTKTIFPDGNFETFSYDTESRLVSKANELGQTTNLEYDQLGRLLATVDPSGARWESQYDAAGRKVADKDPLNRVTAYQFDNLDRITKVVRPDNSFVTNSYDAVGNLLSTVDALGNLWSWEYDKLNRQIKAFQPANRRGEACLARTTTYDVAGQVIAETDALNRTTQYTFDNGGRRTATTDALGNVWQNIYDNAGRLVATKDPLGAVSSLTYDIMDRVISQSDALGNPTSFEFDNAGRRVAKTDAMGRRSITVYDQRDRVTAEADPEGHIVQFGYNAAGQRVSLTDAANRTWRWDYNSLGRVTAEYDPLGNTNRYAFDSVGNRTSWTNARSQTTTYTFNEMNRLTAIAYPDGTLATMSYDLEGRELVRSGTSGMVTKTWDSVGNMMSESFFVGVGPRADPISKKWQYSFDLVGNRIGATDPEGGIFNYQYSPLNQLVFLDPPGRNDEVRLSYDAAGRQISESKPNVYTENVYDLAGRLLTTTHSRAKGQKPVLASRQYTYNAVGNRVSQTDEAGKTTVYSFDGSDWLIAAVNPDGTNVSWEYNNSGDRISETVGSASPLVYNYDAGGRMISRGSDVFSFDPDGNLIEAIENGITTRNTWNSDNRLTQVESYSRTGSYTEVYSYAPEDWRRVSRTANGKTFVEIYDNNDEALEYELVSGRTGQALELVRQFISGPGMDDMKFSLKGRRQYGILTDALGSVIALTTPSGRVIAKIPYSAWGELLQAPDGKTITMAATLADLEAYIDRLESSRSLGGESFDPYATGRRYGPALSPHLYTMRRYESLTKNWWHRNRFMNPKHGRFISKDPIGFEAGPNLFIYVGNNPQKWVDPFGLLIDVVFVLKTGEIVVTDRDTKQQVYLLGESGGKPYGDPIPAGTYEILEQGKRSDFFRLDAVDPDLRDDVRSVPGENVRMHLRLHRPGRTIGCIAAKEFEAWEKAKDLISNTRTTTVDDYYDPTKYYWSSWIKSFFGGTKMPSKIKKFGDLRVIESWDNY